MRKIIVTTFVTLDGVTQAPGGPEEDVSGNFKFGGWTFPYFDEVGVQIMSEQMGQPFDLLLGRKTFEIWASYWPHHQDDPFGVAINNAKKYVASTTLTQHGWQNTSFLNGDVVAEVKKLKQQQGSELQVYGSANFIQTLLSHDLVDELWLMIFPVTLGSGKHLFDKGTIPAAFTLLESKSTPAGVITAKFRRAGEVKTGSF
ncbi:MAG: dihydrofolate reductase [Gallionella sp.]|nr:dihydrofolate reductase [Gallionella sp.]